MTIERNPYRGPFSFKDVDEDMFFGRKSETGELIDLIRKNQLTVLYGASGTGKTSLIHAKLLPQLKREYFHPIYIRINFANKHEDPLRFIQKRIVEELRTWDEYLPDFESEQTLINYAAKNVIFKGLIKPVLFFDQFEELFTLGPKNDPYKIHGFMFQLSELIELRLPDNLKTENYINNISSFKVVFSLRQDWIGFLDDFSQLIPSINEERYRLKKFSSSQAIEAIIGPTYNRITLETAEEIIKKIGTPALWKEIINTQNNIGRDLLNIEIDPFVLSLYCYQLYDKSVELGHSHITTEFVLTHHDSELIRNYYEEKIENYRKIKNLIEDKLLNESGKRLIISLSKFVSGEKNLEELAYKVANETGIVRIVGTGNESEIEIVHDRLALQIFESKNERITKEIHKEATKKEQQAENLKESARKAKKTTFRISIVAVVIIVLLTSLTIAIYIDAKNNKTIPGLEKQLLNEKETNRKGQDSMKVLLSLIDNFNKVKSTQYRGEVSQFDEQQFRKNNVDPLVYEIDSMKNIIEQQNKLLDIQNNKDIIINNLRGELSSKEAIINSFSELNSQISNLNVPTTNSSHNFQQSDFSNFKMTNLLNTDGSYNFYDIKRKGFQFTFNIASIFSNEKGKIEIRVYYNYRKKGSLDSSYENSIELIPNLRAMAQPAIVVKAPGDLKPGKASYEIKYFVERDDLKTTYRLATNFFIISKPQSNE